MAIYTGSSLEDIELIEINDDDPDRGCCSSWIGLVDAQAMTNYYINISPLSLEAGLIKLSWGPLILGNGAPNIITGTPAAEEIRGMGERTSSPAPAAPTSSSRAGPTTRSAAGPGTTCSTAPASTSSRATAGSTSSTHATSRAAIRLFGGPGADNCRADRTDTRSGC